MGLPYKWVSKIGFWSDVRDHGMYGVGFVDSAGETVLSVVVDSFGDY